MNIYVPDYYKDFKCIADRCNHSCCIGWEIEIDEDTYDFYKSLKGDFGKKLINSISLEDKTAQFILDSKDRCPFLNDNYLCDIICTLGENSLCQICKDHPRFRNFFSDRTEIGLGLCCEEACRIILTNNKKTEIIPLEISGEEDLTAEEKDFLKLRNKLFEILQNRSKTIGSRVKETISFMDINLAEKSFNDWVKIYLSLEQLDSSWTKRLYGALNQKSELLVFKYEIVFEQLLIYFISRHLSDGIYDNTLKNRVGFSIHATFMIMELCKNFECIDGIIDVARQYSAEIEYSDENLQKLINIVCD